MSSRSRGEFTVREKVNICDYMRSSKCPCVHELTSRFRSELTKFAFRGVLEGDGLRRPRSYGRAIRLVIRQYGTLLCIKGGWLPPSETAKLTQWNLEEYYDFQKIIEHKPVKRLTWVIPLVLDFHRSLQEWTSIDIADMQRLSRSFRALVGIRIVLQVEAAVLDFHYAMDWALSLSNPLKRGDGQP